MAGAVVAMEFVVLAVLLKFRFVLVDLFRRWGLVVVAEEADHRTGEVFGVIDGRDRLFGSQLFFGLNDAAAPAFDQRVEVFQPAGGEKRRGARRSRCRRRRLCR